MMGNVVAIIVGILLGACGSDTSTGKDADELDGLTLQRTGTRVVFEMPNTTVVWTYTYDNGHYTYSVVAPDRKWTLAEEHGHYTVSEREGWLYVTYTREAGSWTNEHGEVIVLDPSMWENTLVLGHNMVQLGQSVFEIL